MALDSGSLWYSGQFDAAGAGKFAVAFRASVGTEKAGSYNVWLDQVSLTAQ